LLYHLHALVGITKLHFTGGEPLLRPDLPALVAVGAALGLEDLALTTNGQGLAERALELARAGLRRVNVSLDSLRPDTFAAITRGGELRASLRGIQAAGACGLRPIKLNVVVLRGLNDDEVVSMLDYALESGCRIRFLELMPIGVAAADFERLFVSCPEVFARIADRFRLEPLPYARGATSRDYLATARRGQTTVCGFISPNSRPFCEGCARLRLTADGRLLGCLAKKAHLELRPVLDAALAGDLNPLAALVQEALAMKHQLHELTEQRDMVRIGG
jgi:cyclic pyranopterin phosphate synthase